MAWYTLSPSEYATGLTFRVERIAEHIERYEKELADIDAGLRLNTGTFYKRNEELREMIKDSHALMLNLTAQAKLYNDSEADFAGQVDVMRLNDPTMSKHDQSIIARSVLEG